MIRVAEVKGTRQMQRRLDIAAIWRLADASPAIVADCGRGRGLEVTSAQRMVLELCRSV